MCDWRPENKENASPINTDNDELGCDFKSPTKKLKNNSNFLILPIKNITKGIAERMHGTAAVASIDKEDTPTTDILYCSSFCGPCTKYST